MSRSTTCSTKIGAAHGGWLDSADSANDPKDFGGKRYGIPFGTSGNLINRRDDVLEPAGFTDAPKTWEELGEMALTVQKPPEVYGMGFALSNVGDGNLTTTRCCKSWGGRIADDAGKTCTIDSAPTRDFLTWITELYKQGVFPPGATTWDGAGDNTAYQSGASGLHRQPRQRVPEPEGQRPRAGDSQQVSRPCRPARRCSVAPQGPNVRVIPTTSSYKEDWPRTCSPTWPMTSSWQEYYATRDLRPGAARARPASRSSRTSPCTTGLLDLAQNGTPPAFPDVDNAAFAEYETNFLTPKMVQRIVVDNKSIDDAVAGNPGGLPGDLRQVQVAGRSQESGDGSQMTQAVTVCRIQ